MNLLLTFICFVLPLQARDAPARRDPVGTASISGVVMSDGPAPLPVRRAIVSVSGAELALVRSTISDDVGRFTIGNLPAGRYTLKAEKPAFITTEFGAKRPGRPGSAMAIADGQAMTGVALRIYRGAVITGRITTTGGRSGSALPVAIVPVPPPGPTHQFTSAPATTVSTDDRGIFRAYGLLPGSYYVVAAARTNLSSRDSVANMKDAEVDAALATLQRGLRGAATTATPTNTSVRAPVGSVGSMASFGAVFYPGTPVVTDAVPIAVATGEERDGVDFAFAPIPTATITGKVVNPYGALPPMVIAINPAGVRLESRGDYDPVTIPRLARDAARGEFMFSNVAPGQYTIAVQSTTVVPDTTRPMGGGRASPAIPVAQSPTLIWATAEVTMNGVDIEGLVLDLRPAMRISGRVVFDGKTTAPPSDLRTLSVNVTSTQSAGRIVYGMTTTVGLTLVPPAQLREDGTFESTGLLPGGYRLLPARPVGWRLRSAMLGDRDLLDYPFEIGGDRDVTGVVVTYTDQRTEIRGTIQTATGAPVADYFVVVFSSNPALWGMGSRRVQTARPATDGHYVVRDLPAGEYLLAAVDDFDPADLQDPSFLRALQGSASKITVLEGQAQTMDFRAVK
jgi:carboxypeptidase family protein